MAIRQYESPISSVRPSEVGVEATAAAARRAGGFFNQSAAALRQLGSETASAGEQNARMVNSSIHDAGAAAVDFEDHREISHGAVAYAGLNDKLTNAWNDTVKNADPNDPTVAAKFREQMETELEKFKGSFNTEKSQAWAETRVDQLRNHMFEKSAADMGTLAAHAVSVNVRNMSNNLSNTAMNDPSSVPHLLNGIETDIKAMIETSPNLKGAAAGRARMELTEQMREGIVKAGAIGAIQKAANPEAEAKRWGEKYPDYINGDTLKALEGNARQQIRADRQDRAYSDHIQKVVQQDRSDATETGYLQKLYSDDPKQQSQVSAKSIVNDPNLTRTSKERMINVVNREMKPETDAKISARTSVELFRMISDPNSDPQKVRSAILDARGNGSLSRTDFNDAMKNLEDVKTPQGAALAHERAEFFKRYAPAIDPSMGDPSSMQFGHHTALGSQKMYEAEKAAQRAEADAKAKGQDPHSVYDPNSPNFFGKPANLMKFRASLQESMQYQDRISKAEKESAFTPPGGWVYSPSRNQYKDPATNKVYGADGKEVKQ